MGDGRPYLSLVGTYREDTVTEEIYTCRVDPATGDLDRLRTTVAGENPFFQAVHPNGEYLYSVDMVDDGRLQAFSIDAESGELSQLNSRPTGDAGPCHLSIDSSGTYVLVANYVGGSVAMLPIEEDGRVGEPTDVVAHSGSSVHPDRQTEPHPHSIEVGPEDRFAYAADLGTDEVVVYEVDADGERLRPVDSVSAAAGAGPRHSDFHPDGHRLYVINELDSTLTTFERDPRTGRLDERGTVSTLPDGFDGENFAADVRVHPSDQWAYGSNRGHDSVALYELDPSTGRPHLVAHEPARGQWPWNVALAQDETHLLATNHDSDDVVTVSVDPETGNLTGRGDTVTVPNPVCVTPLPRNR